MRTSVQSGQFKRDVKKAERRGKDLSKLRDLLLMLLKGEDLPAAYRDHALRGDWNGFRDAHIEPDWLLIYKVDGDELRLARTGSHSDLFD